MGGKLLQYYEAIENISSEMLLAARDGDWDQVVKLEGACAVLISGLKQAAGTLELNRDDRRHKTQIMKRILINDAEIRALAEPDIDELGQLLSGRSQAPVH